MGWDELYAISAAHGRGTGDLMDALVWALPPETEAEVARKAREAEAEEWAEEVAAGHLDPFVVGDPEAEDEDADDAGEPGSPEDTEAAKWDAAMAAEKDGEPAAIAFVGRPNVGKSSLVNALLGEDRAIVSDVPGTTRDAIDTRLAWGRSEVVLIDTAGIRRRGKVASGPAAEKYSTLRALRALGRADVAVLVIDAVEGLTAQDAHVAGYVVEEGKGLVIAVNKWDLLEEKTDRTFDQYTTWIRNEVPFLDFAPIISISAKTGQRVGRVLEAAVDIWGERRRRIGTGELNRLLTDSTDRFPPPLVRGRRPKLFYATQAAVAPPTFVFFASDAASVHFSYRRYLENRLRETFGFDGTPIRLVFRDRTSVKLPRHKRNPGKAGGPKASMSKGSKPKASASGAPKTGRPRTRSRAGPVRARSSRIGPARATDERATRRGRRGRGVGDHAGSRHRPGRAGDAALPLRGDRGRDPRHRPQRATPAGGGPATDGGGHGGSGGARRTRRISSLFAAPSAHLRTTAAGVAPYLAGLGGRPVRRQGSRARHAAADERGHRRGDGDLAPDGSPRCPARTWPRRWRATCRRRRSSRRPDLELAERIVARMARRRFRLYVNQDILGVELAGATKNVVAIAAGAADGLGFGDNGKAGLLTRGLAEMMRLGIAAGANPLTFAGLAGMGDLIATCGSSLSRNHRLGEELAKGRTWAEIEADLPGTAEGAYTVQAALGAGRSSRRRDADRPRGPPGAVRGQEREALPGRPAGPRVEGRTERQLGLAGPRRPRSRLTVGPGAGARLRRLSGRGAVW